MNFKNQKITIFGAGKSGMAAAARLAALGAKIYITESASTIKSDIMQQIHNLPARLELGGHSTEAIADCDLVIVSPGVHLDLPVLASARQKNIPIISEIELAYRLLKRPIVAITGTNGKTTTTTLVGEMLKKAGKRIAVAGNIGLPLIAVEDDNLDLIVAEISSYQLEAIELFKPWISAILNIQPDHLERHHNLEEYIKQKARIFENQTGDDYLVYNQDDPLVVEMVKSSRSKRVGFSKSNTSIITIRPEEIKIPGRHNLENSLAAAQIAFLCGVAAPVIGQVLKTFPGVPHRIEYVTSVRGIEFRNDSKGTNPDSTLVAIDTFSDRGIVLMLGGRDKGVSLDRLVAAIKNKVKAVVLMGEAAPRFTAALKDGGFDNITQAGFSLENAVGSALALAAPGEVVLFSPACASFDMFNNYEERGDQFKQLCHALK